MQHFPPVVERSRSCGPGFLAEVLSPKKTTGKRAISTNENIAVGRNKESVSRIEREWRLTTCNSLSLLNVDSTSSNFHSMDGLAASFPLARKEAKQRLQSRYNALKRKEKRSRRQQQRSNLSLILDNTCGIGCNDQIPLPTVKEEQRLRLRHELLQLKLQLQELRKSKQHSVKFSDPLVNEVRYRPYTDECDIATLYFQEEELDLLEEDRYSDPGDIVECEFVEAVRAVSVAYRKRGNDE